MNLFFKKRSNSNIFRGGGGEAESPKLYSPFGSRKLSFLGSKEHLPSP